MCLIDDELKDPNLRPRRTRTQGQATTTLTDAEVLTIELVGQFWRLDADTALYRHFRAYHAAEFPALTRVHRTTIARRAADLRVVKHRLHRRLADRLCCGQPV